MIANLTEAVGRFFGGGGKRRQERLPRWLGSRIRIDREPTDVFAFWRRPTNLVMVLRILQALEVHEGGRSTWTLRSPSGESLTWQCRPVNVEGEQRLEWISVDDAPVHSTFSVSFLAVDGGTEIALEWTLVGRKSEEVEMPSIAPFLDETAQRMLDDDLRRLKASLEAEGVRLAAEARAEAEARLVAEREADANAEEERYE